MMATFTITEPLASQKLKTLKDIDVGIWILGHPIGKVDTEAQTQCLQLRSLTVSYYPSIPICIVPNPYINYF